MCFQLSGGDAAAALRDARFFKTPYVGDKGGVSLIVDRPPRWREVAELALKSFCEVAPDALRHEVVSPSAPKRRRARR
jgi:hypothetical protein